MKVAIEVMIRRMARLFGMRLIVVFRPPWAARRLQAIRRLFGVLPERMPPTTVATSTKEWVKRSAASSGSDYREIEGTATQQRQLPGTCDASLHWKFVQRITHPDPPSFLASIPGASVVGKAGHVVAPGGTVLADVSLEWYIPPESHSSLFKFRLPTPQHLGGTSAALSVASGNAYYHWLVDVLPRLALLEKAGVGLKEVDHFVLNGGEQRFQQESLDWLGIPASRRIFTSDRFHSKCDRLLVPSRAGISGNAPAWVVDFLRERFCPTEPVAQPGQRLYISRSRAKYRHLTKEREVRRLLEKHGFLTVFLESMTFREQINLFSSAEAVVAPHGGGLTNIVFCPHGTKIIELFSPKYVNECFWVLANHAQLDYFCHVGAGRSPGANKDSQASEADISAEPEVLVNLLKKAGIA